MDKRTDMNRAPDPRTTRDFIGMEATTGDPDAVTGNLLDDNTAPGREEPVYGSTAYVAPSTTDRDRGVYDRDERHGQRSTADIERDIEQTRAEMSSTIDEIEERLSPRHIKRQIRESVHDTIDSVQDRFSPSNLTYAARGAGRNMFEAIKENPLPAILTGIGLAWWVRMAGDQGGGNDFRTRYASRYPARGRYSRSNRYGYYGDEDYYRRNEPMYEEESMSFDEPASYRSRRSDRDYGQYERGYGERSTMDRAREKAGEIADQAENMAGELKERAGSTMSEIQDRAGEFADEAQYKMRSAARQVEYRARSASNWLEDMMQERPMAAGAVALGVGAMIGMALPGTRKEDELMGRKRDQLVDEMGDTAREYAEKAEHVADRATQEIKQSVKDVAEASKDEAKKQGLTGATSSGSSQGNMSGSSPQATTPTNRDDSFTGTKPGASTTGQIGGTSGASGLDKPSPSVGSAADRNKGGSKL